MVLFIAGIIFMSAMAILAEMCFDENKNFLGMIFLGPVAWMLALIGFIHRFIKTLIKIII